MSTTGGRFDFDDGGTYAGGWEDGKANGSGVCTGPKGQGEFAGAWHMGFETSGVYTWSSGNNFKGQWMQGKRHGVGVEVKGRWIYQGEWTQGFKGRYGIRYSTSTGAKYEGTWTTGLQDGYGVETYADGGTYQGQWLRGIRHGYGVRQSVPYGLAAHHQQKMGRESLTSLRSEHEEDSVVKDRDRKLDEKRGGFILSAVRSDDVMVPIKKRSGSAEAKTSSRSSIRKTLMEGLKLRKQKSTGDIQDVPGRLGSGGSVRSTVSNISHGSYGSFQSSMTAASVHTNSNASFISQDDVTDVNMVETYSGEWKNDKRSGFGISERSDGLRYEGEWDGNKRHGYGSTTFRDGTKEEGKYKNNVLISTGKKSKLLMLRAGKLRDRIQNAVTTAKSAAQIALQKADIAITRMATARTKAEMAVLAASKAQSDADKARVKAKEHAPDFLQPAENKTTEQVPIRSPLLSFVDHYDITASPRPRPEGSRPSLPAAIAAKTILQRVANIAGVEMTPVEPRKPPPSIASALVSVAMDSSAPFMKNINNRGVGGGLGIGLGGLAIGLGLGAASQSATQRTTDAVDAVGLRKPEIADLAEVRNKDTETSPRMSEILSPTLIDDHFDQYQSRPSTLSSRPDRDRVRPRNPYAPDPTSTGLGGRTSTTYSASRSHETGSSQSSRPSSAMSRRQTLTEGQGWTPTSPQSSTKPPTDTHRRTGGPAERTNENGGINYQGVTMATPQQQVASSALYRTPARIAGGGGGLTRATGKKGSMPDVVEVTTGARQKQMSREEVHLMSLRRREEIRREREAENRRRQDEVVLSFSEFKEWCRQRQLIVLVLAVNISLATMFFNLLSS